MASSPIVPQPSPPEELKHVVEDAKITTVTVYTTNRAEITRTLSFKLEKSGLYDVLLEGLPASADGDSLRVSGTGLCTILNVSYRTELKTAEKDEPAGGAERKQLEATLKKLAEEMQVLHQNNSRGEQMRRLVEQYAANVASPPVPSGGGSAQPPVSLETLDGVVAYCRSVSEASDKDQLATTKQLRNLEEEMTAVQQKLAQLGHWNRGNSADRMVRQAVVSIDASAPGTVDLEFRYIVQGAWWNPLYDIRIGTQDSAITCSYYANVKQTTGEDWENVKLSLSTAEPTVQGTPPTLDSKTVNWKTPPPRPAAYGGMPMRKMARGGMAAKASSAPGGGGDGAVFAFGAADEPMAEHAVMFGAPQMAAMSVAAAAPPPPPMAAPATTGVTGGGGALGSVSYQVPQPATVKSDGARKKLTVGVLSLTAEVTHYIVPSKVAAAYLQAKATNDTEFMLLASSDVSVFFDNAFVTKTDLNMVSPGESFQMFLGCDASVKVTYLPPRKSSKKSGVFSKSDTATFTHRTTIHNAKSVPVVVAMVDALPRSAQDAIAVKMREPKLESVEAVNYGDDNTAVLAALEVAAAQNKPSKILLNKDTSTLIWVLRIAPGQELHVPFEYAVEWPSNKEVEIC